MFGQHGGWPSLDELDRYWLRGAMVQTLDGIELRIVAQPKKLRRAKPRDRDALYDVSVCKGQLPTRPSNWHDFFNVLMFAAFPRSKLALHERHRRILEHRIPDEVTRLPGARTVEQDCLTMLDEGGVLLNTSRDQARSIEALLDTADHRGLAAQVRQRALQPWLIGHAHAEHLAKAALHLTAVPLPRAKPILLTAGLDASRQAVDAALAERLQDPSFCADRDGRRAVSLVDLYLDLTHATPLSECLNS